jgi:hypothetical protein
MRGSCTNLVGLHGLKKKRGNLNFKIYYGMRGTGFCSFYVKEHMELTVVRERGKGPALLVFA